MPKPTCCGSDASAPLSADAGRMCPELRTRATTTHPRGEAVELRRPVLDESGPARAVREILVAAPEPGGPLPSWMLAPLAPKPEGLDLVKPRPELDVEVLRRLGPIARPVPDPLVEVGTLRPSSIFVDFDATSNGTGTETSPFNAWAPVLPLLPLASAGKPGPIVFLAGTARTTLGLRSKGGIAGAPIRIVLWPGRTFTLDGGRKTADSTAWPVLYDPSTMAGAGFALGACQHILIDGVAAASFVIQGVAGFGILTSGTSHLTVRNVTVQWTSNSGMLFGNSAVRTCAGKGLRVERCRLDHTNLGRYTWNAPPCTFDLATEALSVENYDGFEICCNHVSNSMMEGIAFKGGSIHGRVHHNLVELTRTVGIYCDEGCLTDIYQNVVRYIGWHDVVGGASPGIKPAASWFNTTNAGCARDYLLAGGYGISIANGDLYCKKETGTTANIRVYQNEVYWTAATAIAIVNHWRTRYPYPCYAFGMAPDKGEIFDIEISHNVCYKAMQGKSFSTPPGVQAFGALDMDEEAMGVQVKSNVIMETHSRATAGIVIVGLDSKRQPVPLSPTDPLPAGFTIANNYFEQNGSTGRLHAQPDAAVGSRAVLNQGDPFVKVPVSVGDGAANLHLTASSQARKAGTDAIYLAPGYQPGGGPAWRKRDDPDIGAHIDPPPIASDWTAGTSCTGLPCSRFDDSGDDAQVPPLVRETPASGADAAGSSLGLALVLGLCLLLGFTTEAQTAWMNPQPSAAPPTRYDSAMAFDAGRVVTLLFGGYQGGAFLSDTWEWDGSQWKLGTSPLSPSARASARMVFDVARSRSVLFGGFGRTSDPTDTWEWDGTAWAQVATAGPPGRGWHAMAYDKRRARVVMLGGYNIATVSDHWEWDGTTWAQIPLVSGPLGKRGHGMAYDEARGRIVVFGGTSLTATYSDDTWEWDGTAWTLHRPAFRPKGREYADLSYDSQRNRIVLFGGRYLDRFNFVDLNDTWEWDGTTWGQRMPANPPPPRSGHGQAYDSVRGRLVVFGGYVTVQGGEANDTWEYYPLSPASYVAFGAGCPGTAGTPVLAALPYQLPWLGDSLGLTLANLPANQPAVLLLGASNTTWGGVSLPLDLTGIGMPGCALLASPDLLLPMSGTSGMATAVLPIPASATLLGQSFHDQGFVLDPGANALGATASQAATGTVGGR